MDTVVPAFIVIFVILFAALSLTYVVISTQDTLSVAQASMEERLAEQTHTELTFVEARTIKNRELIELTLRNTGSTRLAGFDHWDVVVKYVEAGTGAARVEYLANDAGVEIGTDDDVIKGWLAEQSWAANLYIDADNMTLEASEPKILNTGETLILWGNVGRVIEPGSVIEISVTTEYGVGLLASFQANMPPTLTNNRLIIGRNDTDEPITAANLLAEDADDPVEDLVFTVTDSSGMSGSLSGDTFTQADIDAGTVSYSRAVEAESESFTFSLSDGKDTLEGNLFGITVNEPPVYAPTVTMLQSGEEVIVPEGALHADDPDDGPENLVYTLTAAPSEGYLSLNGSELGAGGTFTLADVAAERLVYHQTGADLDSFSFEISDGRNDIGPHTVNILAPEG